jgi:hypothetical protein
MMMMSFIQSVEGRAQGRLRGHWHPHGSEADG